MHKASAILLAAGLSSRMGAQNKLVLPVQGEPLCRRVVRAYLHALDGPVTIVIGFEADALRDALKGLDVRFAYNDGFAEGQPGSVVTGLRYAPETELLLIGLSDQPLLTSEDLTHLIAAHRAGDPTRITIPYDSGRRGNPIVVPHRLRPRLTENPDRPGCMRFTRDNPDHVQTATLAAPGFYKDIDTPEDFARLTADLLEDTP